MINAAELAGLQATLAPTRTQFATIFRQVVFPDGAGGQVQSWEPVDVDVSARLSPQGMQPWEKIDRIEHRIIATSVWLIWLEPGLDVRAADRIEVDDQTYEVTSASIRAVPLETKVQAVLLT